MVQGVDVDRARYSIRYSSRFLDPTNSVVTFQRTVVNFQRLAETETLASASLNGAKRRLHGQPLDNAPFAEKEVRSHEPPCPASYLDCK